MKKKKNTKKLTVSRETLATMNPENLEPVVGQAAGCQESIIICSVMHSCVSCQTTATEA